ncbi:DUF4395 domain-containing protein [Evansella sp. AB-rgal1]|uniref:DUF4395 domain-containing protein n=1 Tax=Evansella sp. AB-rgal1 TaxID=3242696 RepID=UPI00359D08E4
MKEVPVTLVKANQIMLASLTLIAILFQSNWVVGITLLLVYASLFIGPKANVAFRIASLLKKDFSHDDTESIVLTRFNQTIAASLLSIGFLTLFTSGHWIGWLFVSMVLVASIIALLGFCVGCFLYYQWKRMSYKVKVK